MGEYNKLRQRIQQALREREDLYRILSAVQRRPLRFSQIKLLLNIKPAQLERLLKALCEMHWIVPHTVPNKAFVKYFKLNKKIAIPDRPVPSKNCKILAEYRLSKLGASVLSAHLANKK